jgi:probable F420-dependent oxidoreductase
MSRQRSDRGLPPAPYASLTDPCPEPTLRESLDERPRAPRHTIVTTGPQRLSMPAHVVVLAYETGLVCPVGPDDDVPTAIQAPVPWRSTWAPTRRWRRVAMEVSVVVSAREDSRPAEEALAVATLADRLGYRELWIGEGPTWDAFALTTAIGLSTDQIGLTAGPIPVSVRDPATIARGAASAAILVGRPVGVALGTSSTRVVEGVHGRSRTRAVSDLAESAAAVKALLDVEGTNQAQDAPAHGFRRRLPPAGGLLTVAAFGDRAIAIAAEHAHRMLLDLVSPEQVAVLRTKLDAAARRAGRRTSPKLAAWLPAAVAPDEESTTQLMRSIAGYLTVRGYSEMFMAAGFGRAVEMARTGAHVEELVGALPDEAARVVGLVGEVEAVRTRVGAYAAAGLDEIAIVPATAGDPGGERTLTALASPGSWLAP